MDEHRLEKRMIAGGAEEGERCFCGATRWYHCLSSYVRVGEDAQRSDLERCVSSGSCNTAMVL